MRARELGVGVGEKPEGETGVAYTDDALVRMGEGTEEGMLIGFAWVGEGLAGAVVVAIGLVEWGIVGVAGVLGYAVVSFGGIILTGVRNDSEMGESTVVFLSATFSSLANLSAAFCLVFAMRVCFSTLTTVAGSASPVEGILLAS